MAIDNTPLIHNQSYYEEEKQVALVREFGYESKRLWKLAGPAIFTSICQYSLGALTQTFAGLVGELELAAVSVENSVIAGLAFGIMVIFYIYINIYWSFVLVLVFIFCLLGCKRVQKWDLVSENGQKRLLHAFDSSSLASCPLI